MVVLTQKGNMFLTILFTLASFSASITRVLMVVVVTIKAARGERGQEERWTSGDKDILIS